MEEIEKRKHSIQGTIIGVVISVFLIVGIVLYFMFDNIIFLIAMVGVPILGLAIWVGYIVNKAQKSVLKFAQDNLNSLFSESAKLKDEKGQDIQGVITLENERLMFIDLYNQVMVIPTENIIAIKSKDSRLIVTTNYGDGGEVEFYGIVSVDKFVELIKNVCVNLTR